MSAFDLNALDSRIRELVVYAREHDVEDRTALFRNLVDLFLTAKAPLTEPTRTQLLDVIEALIPHVDPENRRTACDLLASMSEPPMDLVHRLAQDRASLAKTLLARAPFDEDQLIALVEATGREHHQELAGRNDLSANVWIALARAAPAARKENRQSTMALWNDNLGVSDVNMTGTHDAVATAESKPITATVTQLHPNKPANTSRDAGTSRMRILRTGEDLITNHIEPDVEDDTLHLVEDQIAGEDNIETPVAAVKPKPAKADSDASTLAEPGPGGWAWRSDRDGFIDQISTFGESLLNASGVEAVGATIMDMLLLNERVGHPISRAFQRRSSIHDAPLYLSNLVRGQRYWTLEATPLFSPCGGMFEGYEGFMTPVVPAENETDIIPADEDPFLEEPEEAATISGDHTDILSSVKADMEAIEADSLQAETDFADNVKKATTQAIESMLGDAMNDALGGALGDVMGDAVKSSLGSVIENTPATNENLSAPAPTERAEPSAILHTLSMLEAALSQLQDAAKSGDAVQIRLQSEIAAACTRSIREQLS